MPQKARRTLRLILTLNSIFYDPDGSQPTGLTNEPLSEWPMKEILEYGPYPAKGDVYGKMTCYVRDKIVAFLERLQQREIHVRLMACGLTEMVGHLREDYDEEPPFFDRIEVVCSVSKTGGPLLMPNDAGRTPL